MVFEEELEVDVEKSATFQSKSQIGKVEVTDLSRIKQICLKIAPLKKQFQRPRRLYPQEPLRRCQEWTAEVVQAIIAENGIYQEDGKAERTTTSDIGRCRTIRAVRSCLRASVLGLGVDINALNCGVVTPKSDGKTIVSVGYGGTR